MTSAAVSVNISQIDHALDEFSSGLAKKKKFTEQDQFVRYRMYLKTITTFGEACPAALRHILQEIHDTSR